MNKLFSQLVRSDIGLDLSTITETTQVFSVRTIPGGPKIIFGLLFGLPALVLLFLAVISPSVGSIIAAIIFCPVLFLVALLFGVSISEKRFDKMTGMFVDTLHILGYSTGETIPLPTTGRIIMKSENRGSSKTAPGSTPRYSIMVENCPGCGFALYDYFKALAFAERLSLFLSLPIENTVQEGDRRERIRF